VKIIIKYRLVIMESELKKKINKSFSKLLESLNQIKIRIFKELGLD